MRTICTFMLYLITSNCYGQFGEIHGVIRSGDTNISFATVGLAGNGYNKAVLSSEDGSFHFSEVPPGTYTLSVNMLGYRSSKKEIIMAAGEPKYIDFRLLKDPLELDHIVVTGTRTNVPSYNSPVIVNKISDRTFQTTQSLSVSEGLNFSPGLRVENNCQNCGFTQLRMNGLDGAYSQILINNRPIFSALAGVYGLEMIPANMVDRIEIVKGGGSVLYGGNAIGGTVNIITRDPIKNSFELGYNHGLINGESSDRTLSFNGSLVNESLDHGISIYGLHRQRDHWDANADGFSEITELKNTTLGLDAFWNINRRNKIKLNLNTINEYRRGGNKFELPPHQTDITEQLDHQIFGMGLSYEHYSKDLRQKVSLYASAQLTNRDSYYGGGGRVLAPGDSLTQGDVLAINAYGNTQDIAAIGGFQYSYDFQKKWILTIGSEYQYNKVKDEMPGYGRSINQEVRTLGTYAQLEWDPIDKLRLLFGGRFDHVKIDGVYDLEEADYKIDEQFSVVVPRITALYEINDRFKARASFAQGYRAPQAFNEDLHIETVGGTARFIRLDPGLETERSNSFTASLNYTNTTAELQYNILLEGFYTQLSNPFILSDPIELPSGISVINKRNGEGASVQGVNLEANFAFPADIILQLGVTLQTAEYDVNEEIWTPSTPDDTRSAVVTDRILRTPNMYGFFTFNYKPMDALSLSWSGVFTGPMIVPHIIEPETEYTKLERTPSFFENNIKIAYTFKLDRNFDLELFGGAQNLFNAYQDDFDTGATRDAGYIYGPGRPRTIFAGVKLGFQ